MKKEQIIELSKLSSENMIKALNIFQQIQNSQKEKEILGLIHQYHKIATPGYEVPYIEDSENSEKGLEQIIEQYGQEYQNKLAQLRETINKDPNRYFSNEQLIEAEFKVLDNLKGPQDELKNLEEYLIKKYPALEDTNKMMKMLTLKKDEEILNKVNEMVEIKKRATDYLCFEEWQENQRKKLLNRRNATMNQVMPINEENADETFLEAGEKFIKKREEVKQYLNENLGQYYILKLMEKRHEYYTDLENYKSGRSLFKRLTDGLIGSNMSIRNDYLTEKKMKKHKQGDKSRNEYTRLINEKVTKSSQKISTYLDLYDKFGDIYYIAEDKQKMDTNNPGKRIVIDNTDLKKYAQLHKLNKRKSDSQQNQVNI